MSSTRPLCEPFTSQRPRPPCTPIVPRVWRVEQPGAVRQFGHFLSHHPALDVDGEIPRIQFDDSIGGKRPDDLDLVAALRQEGSDGAADSPRSDDPNPHAPDTKGHRAARSR